MSGKSHIFPNLLNIEKHLFEIALKGKLNCNKYVSPQWRIFGFVKDCILRWTSSKRQKIMQYKIYNVNNLKKFAFSLFASICKRSNLVKITGSCRPLPVLTFSQFPKERSFLVCQTNFLNNISLLGHLKNPLRLDQ